MDRGLNIGFYFVTSVHYHATFVLTFC